MGAQLAREAPAEADVIVPVPDSGVPAAMGYSQASGIPYEMGIIRNHYVGRTFIEPTQHIRQLGVRLKHSANRAVVNGKRIVLVDDSIVRGTTSLKIVQMMRDAGAKEVHFRISSPPITHPDYYGIDTPERDKLLAATHDLEGMRKFIGADSLAFLSVEGIYKAMGFEARDPVRPQFTDHCFTGEYPTGLTDQTGQQSQPRQLSLLAEAGLKPHVSPFTVLDGSVRALERWAWLQQGAIGNLVQLRTMCFVSLDLRQRQNKRSRIPPTRMNPATAPKIGSTISGLGHRHRAEPAGTKAVRRARQRAPELPISR